MTNDKKLRVGIVGATGYTGVELLRLLANHPLVEVTALTSRKDAGVRVVDIFPSLRGFYDSLAFCDPESAQLTQCDFVFFATPHGVAMQMAPELVAAGVRIIDLAADFRIKDTQVFQQWYKLEHSAPELLAQAVYGQPETMRKELKNARVAGMAGCYPTSIELGLMPLMRYEKVHPGTLELGTIIADSKSGISGAGRKAALNLLAAEMSDNFHAYSITGHRHQPEIEQQLKLLSGSEAVHLTFVPHLLPTIRGIHSTIYVRLKPGKNIADVQKLYEEAYAHEYFVDVMPENSCPELRSVRGSNFARIALHQEPETNLIVILVVEDNLVKGAAGQAVQTMNLMANFDESMGLTVAALMP